MKVIKDRYKLVLREPGKEEKELWVGSKRGCEKKKLEEMNLEKVVVVDHNDEVGDLETTYSGVTSSGVEVEDSITFSFSAESSLTYLKPNFF